MFRWGCLAPTSHAVQSRARLCMTMYALELLEARFLRLRKKPTSNHKNIFSLYINFVNCHSHAVTHVQFETIFETTLKSNNRSQGHLPYQLFHEDLHL